MKEYTIRPFELRKPVLLKVRPIQLTELSRCCKPATIKSVEAYNAAATTHNASVADLLRDVESLTAGTIPADPIKLVARLRTWRLELALECRKLCDQWMANKRQIEADYSAWKIGATRLYDDSKRKMSEQALALAGGSQMIADQIVTVAPGLREMRSDAITWNGPDIISVTLKPTAPDLDYAIAIAVADAAGITLDLPLHILIEG